MILRTHFVVLGSGLKSSKTCPVLGSRTGLFFKSLKLCGKTPETSRKISKDYCYFPLLEIALKISLKNLCFGKHLRLCPWPQAFLCLASSGSVLGRAALASHSFVALALASSLMSSTPPLIIVGYSLQ